MNSIYQDTVFFTLSKRCSKLIQLPGWQREWYANHWDEGGGNSYLPRFFGCWKQFHSCCHCYSSISCSRNCPVALSPPRCSVWSPYPHQINCWAQGCTCYGKGSWRVGRGRRSTTGCGAVLPGSHGWEPQGCSRCGILPGRGILASPRRWYMGFVSCLHPQLHHWPVISSPAFTIIGQRIHIWLSSTNLFYPLWSWLYHLPVQLPVVLSSTS